MRKVVWGMCFAVGLVVLQTGCKQCCSTWDYAYPMRHSEIAPPGPFDQYERAGSISGTQYQPEMAEPYYEPTPADPILPAPGTASTTPPTSLEPAPLPTWSSAHASPVPKTRR